MSKPRKLTRRNAIIALTFLVAGAVGFESWQATAAAAATGGRPHPDLWPVTAEAFIAVLVLVYWEARSGGRPATGARVLLGLITLLASAILVLDVFAGTATGEKLVLGIVTAAWTPIALNLTVEFATWLLYGDRSPTPVPEPAPTAAGGGAPPPSPAATPAAGRRGRPAGADAPSPTTPAGGGLTPAQARLIRNMADQSEAATVRALKAQGIGTRREKVAAERARLAQTNGHPVSVDA